MPNNNLAQRIEYGPNMRDTAQNVLFVTGTKATTGATTVIAAPGAGRQIVIKDFSIQSETSNAQVMQLGVTAGAYFWRIRAATDGEGEALNDLFWSLGANQGLTLTISAAYTCGYSIAYYIEDI